jgi:hypothetical protein
MEELLHPKTPSVVRAWAGSPPEWLTVQDPTQTNSALKLGGGETAAIALAEELKADWVLMGITIAYRGRLADLARIEDFEDRLVDNALEMGAQVRIWRSWADDHPERMVRGVILDLAPGHESTSLLLSPEGWLIGLTDIEDVEEGRLKELPWCFVKTQFGPVEGHVALVEMLTALKREFLADLEVSDEGGYWETCDLVELVRRRALTEQAIDGLAEGLRRHGLSREAAEDPSILLRHVERVAEQVHRILRRPAEHPPVAVEEDDDLGEEDPEAEGDRHGFRAGQGSIRASGR